MAATKLYFDGGARPNPGRIETAVVVRGDVHVRTHDAIGGSMDAEWLALIDALAIARLVGADDLILIGDAAHVVARAAGRMRSGPGDAVHLARFQALAGGFARVRLRHVRRSHNLAGAVLARHRR